MLKLRYMLFVLALAGTLFLSLGADASLAAPAGPSPVVIIETTMGRVIIMLYPKEAPITCMNFLRYVDEGFYDGTVFHRIVKMEVDEQVEKKKQQAINIVQGGGYVYPLRRKPPLWGPIPNEGGSALDNVKGTVAMARGNDPNSAQCEFFFQRHGQPRPEHHGHQEEGVGDRCRLQPGQERHQDRPVRLLRLCQGDPGHGRGGEDARSQDHAHGNDAGRACGTHIHQADVPGEIAGLQS